MAETIRGFLGLTVDEWSRALSKGGLSLAPEKDGDSEPDEQVELTHEEQVDKARDLAAVMMAATTELDLLPREALIDAAWIAIANHHVEGTVWGYDNETVAAFEKVKDFRLSLLTDEERERAIILANSWLDDNFDN